MSVAGGCGQRLQLGLIEPVQQLSCFYSLDGLEHNITSLSFVFFLTSPPPPATVAAG